MHRVTSARMAQHCCCLPSLHAFQTPMRRPRPPQLYHGSLSRFLPKTGSSPASPAAQRPDVKATRASSHRKRVFMSGAGVAAASALPASALGAGRSTNSGVPTTCDSASSRVHTTTCCCSSELRPSASDTSALHGREGKREERIPHVSPRTVVGAVFEPGPVPASASCVRR